MKKLSFLLAIMSFMLFSVTVQAQESGCTKAQIEACKKICSKAAAKGTATKVSLNAEAQKTNVSPKPSCSAKVVKTAATTKKANCNPANCIPANCPPGCKPKNCLPANCKVKSSSSTTAVAVKLDE